MTKLKIGIFLLFILLAVASGKAQSTNFKVYFNKSEGFLSGELQSPQIHFSLVNKQVSPSPEFTSLLTHLRDDILYLISEPDFYSVIGVLGGCPYLFESAFKNESPELNEMWVPSGFADQFFEFGDGMGNAILPLTASAICYSIGRLRYFPHLISFSSDLLSAQAINGLLTLGLKATINRKRPDGAPYSCPSGHSSAAFTSAGVIYHYFGAFWGLPAYFAATYVGLSRLQENKHYLTDVIGGAVLGSYVAYKVTHRRGQKSGYSISPLITDKAFGARLVISF